MKNDERKPDRQGDVASDTEELVGGTASSDKLTDRKRVQPSDADALEDRDKASNPPHMTTGKVTSPAFGSGISGGALADPGPPKD